MVVGRVVRFDAARGYGFIAPEHGGEDVFLHANDLLMPESFVHSGVSVEFEIEEGDRGPKASSVRLPRDAVDTAPGAYEGPEAGRQAAFAAQAASSARTDSGDEPLCDVLSVAEYTRSVTELLLNASPELTGHQILEIRRRLVQFGRKHGWTED